MKYPTRQSRTEVLDNVIDRDINEQLLDFHEQSQTEYSQVTLPIQTIDEYTIGKEISDKLEVLKATGVVHSHNIDQYEWQKAPLDSDEAHFEYQSPIPSGIRITTPEEMERIYRDQ